MVMAEPPPRSRHLQAQHRSGEKMGRGGGRIVQREGPNGWGVPKDLSSRRPPGVGPRSSSSAHPQAESRGWPGAVPPLVPSWLHSPVALASHSTGDCPLPGTAQSRPGGRSAARRGPEVGSPAWCVRLACGEKTPALGVSSECPGAESSSSAPRGLLLSPWAPTAPSAPTPAPPVHGFCTPPRAKGGRKAGMPRGRAEVGCRKVRASARSFRTPASRSRGSAGRAQSGWPAGS